jgi:hypothetical protein
LRFDVFKALAALRRRQLGLELAGARGRTASADPVARHAAADPSGGAMPALLVGQNREGQWVVRDTLARRGGLFGSRQAALRFAMRERQTCPGAVIVVCDVLELFATPSAAQDRAAEAATRRG